MAHTMARPAGYQWEPLGWDTDPVPGDPQVILAEAAHLVNVARQVTDQVAALQKIAAEGIQIGRTPDAIRSSAGTLAGQLGKVAGRYEKVAAALRGWAPELEQAQRLSVQALNQAEVPYAKLRQQVILPSGPDLTTAQKQEVTAHDAAMRLAQDELSAARALLARAITLRDTQAAYYKAKIDGASNGALADSWWDHVENWVSENAGILKEVCTVLEFVATGLAIAALIFSGVGLLVALGIGATALALAGRTLLAATGNGSWAEVVYDAASLVFFGTGKYAGKLMQGTYDLTKGVAGGLVQAARDASPLGKVGSTLIRAGDLVEDNSLLSRSVSVLGLLGRADLGESVAGMAGMAGTAGRLLGKLGDAALEKASPSVEKTLEAVSENIKPGEVALYGGEKESLLLTRKMTALVTRFPRSAQIAQIAQLDAKFRTYLTIQRSLFAADTVTDIGDKIASHAPGMEAYRDFKDSFTSQRGLTTAQANDVVNMLQPGPVAGAGPAEFRKVPGGGW